MQCFVVPKAGHAEPSKRKGRTSCSLVPVAPLQPPINRVLVHPTSKLFGIVNNGRTDPALEINIATCVRKSLVKAVLTSIIIVLIKRGA